MIQINNLSVQAGEFLLDRVSLEIPYGKYGVLMGATGCGKTTLMEAMCGLKEPLAGSIFLKGRDVTLLPPGARGVGYVPQDGALFPTMSVYDQLAFGPRVQKWDRVLVENRVGELAKGLGIQHLLQRTPKGLSGGERQRVALGRALAPNPGVLCLDEPLSALDEDTHADMVSLIKKFAAEENKTVLHITHSSKEAKEVGDMVFRMKDGKLIGEPEILETA